MNHAKGQTTAFAGWAGPVTFGGAFCIPGNGLGAMAMVAILVNAIRGDGPDRVWLVRGIASGSTKRTCLGQMVEKGTSRMVGLLGNSLGWCYR